jgi:ribosomal protein L11 methyltransferase
VTATTRAGRRRRRALTWALHTEVDLDHVNLHLAALEEAGLLGIAEQDGRATVYLPARDDRLPLPGRWERVPERDWNEVWKDGIEPVRAGRFVIVAPWLPHDPAEAGVIVVEPGQAFGTGHHETTSGCLLALQEFDLTARRVLDVGTGTGVLAICAARLGAEVVAVDTDPLAVQAATENSARNRVPVDVRPGSLDAVEGERFDVIVANLDTTTLCALAPRLAAALAAGGAIVASGMSLEHHSQAVTALRAAGLAVGVRAGREWVVLVARLVGSPEGLRAPAGPEPPRQPQAPRTGPGKDRGTGARGPAPLFRPLLASPVHPRCCVRPATET